MQLKKDFCVIGSVLGLKNFKLIGKNAVQKTQLTISGSL